MFLRIDGSDATFDDNFFDVDGGERVVVHVSAPGMARQDVEKRLKVMSLADAFATK